MFVARPLVCYAGLATLVAVAGCAVVPKSQLTACQSQNRVLSEQSKAQLAEIANLKSHSRKVENELMVAEQELATVDARAGVDRQRLANYKTEREQLHKQLDGLFRNSQGTGWSNAQLAELARRYPRLKFDPQIGACKLDTDVLFDSGEARLKPESQRILQELAAVIDSPEGRQLRVMVVGHTDDRQVARRDTRQQYPDNWHLSTARALAVAGFLRQSGLGENQVGVAGYGGHQPISVNGSAEDRQSNRRVEIFVVGPDTPVIGWTESTTSLY